MLVSFDRLVHLPAPDGRVQAAGDDDFGSSSCRDSRERNRGDAGDKLETEGRTCTAHQRSCYAGGARGSSWRDGRCRDGIKHPVQLLLQLAFEVGGIVHWEEETNAAANLPISLFEPVTQTSSGGSESRSDSPLGNIEGDCDLAIGVTVEVAQDDGGGLLWWKRA